ncbi:FkbM family methyltransferase [Bacteroidia bacterium]|nr:FkbM family methyltransferase [Bacteroidia bacterium]
MIFKRLNKYFGAFPSGIKKLLNFQGIELIINKLDSGGTYYHSNKTYEEINSRLYGLIEENYRPKIFLDIGANYGLISIISSLRFESAKIIAVEASKILIPYIVKNFHLNSIKNYDLLHCICGAENSKTSTFSINPYSSQDSRVKGESSKWKNQIVETITINSILETSLPNDPVFIKIDTQGFEESVFRGASKFLTTNSNWIVKSEFGPYWLKSQGTEPKIFLMELVEKYDVAELPATIPLLVKSTSELFQNLLKPECIDDFLQHIILLNKDNRGWVDIIIRPKTDL